MLKSITIIFSLFCVTTFLFAQESIMELNGTSTTQDDITVSYFEGYFTNSTTTKIQVWNASKHPYANGINGGNDYLDISISPATYIVSIKVAYETNVSDLVLQFIEDGSVVKEVSGFASSLKENTTYSVGTIADVIRLYDTGTRSNSGGFELSHIIFDSSMPVELTSFSAIKFENAVKLLWETATEVNNYGFEVERRLSVNSGQSSEWETIGFVEGHGNSNSPKSYEFIDETAPADNLEYRLKQIDTDGKYEYYNLTAKVDNNITDVQENSLFLEFALEQNYPNPFNPTTTINYSIPAVSGENSWHVQLKIYDLLGKEVATLVNKEQVAGNYSVNFDAGNLPSGIYIYRITAGKFVQSHKMLVIK